MPNNGRGIQPHDEHDQDEPQLNAANRCDVCGARAWVRATMPSGGQLFFCGHHANEHLPSLVGSGAQILDERHFMTD